MPQELSSSPDGANETVVIKKRLRVKNVIVERGGNVVFYTERANIDNATDVDRKTDPGPNVIRSVEAVLPETVTVAGQPVSFQNAMTILGKFYDKWRAEDIAAQVPPP